jgi:hypothetical protein
VKGWKKELPALAERLAGERAAIETAAAQIHTEADALDVLDLINRAWSGSPGGYNARLYYRGFDEPSFQESFDREWAASTASRPIGSSRRRRP